MGEIMLKRLGFDLENMYSNNERRELFKRSYFNKEKRVRVQIMNRTFKVSYINVYGVEKPYDIDIPLYKAISECMHDWGWI